MMKANVIESSAMDHNMVHPFGSKLMSFEQYTQDWLSTITKDARDRFRPDARAADSKTSASRLNPEPVRDRQHQTTGDSHAKTCS